MYPEWVLEAFLLGEGDEQFILLYWYNKNK